MSSEPRHGPVTMHRAIERAMLKRIATPPPDTPRNRPAASDGNDEQPRATDPAARGPEPRTAGLLRRSSSGSKPRRGRHESSG
jgi:hypothetical protein